MKFTHKTVAAFLLLSLHGAAAGTTAETAGKKGRMSMSMEETIDEMLDLVCDAPTTPAPTCEGEENGVGNTLGGVISDCQTNIRNAGYYYFTGNIDCLPGDDNTAISIGAAGGNQIDGTVIVDCKGFTIDGMMNSRRAFGGLRADRVIIKNCGIQNFSLSGIGNTARAGIDLVFDNIVSTGNGNKGININAGAAGFTRSVTISNSKLDSNQREGARVESDQALMAVTVYDTTFNGNGQDGFRGNTRADGNDYLLTDIVANNNGENGVRIGGLSATNVAISGTEANENAQRGIRVDSASDIQISRSEACDNDTLENDINNSDIRLPGAADVDSEGVTCDDSLPNNLCDCTCPVETPAPSMAMSVGGKKGSMSRM